MVILDCGDNSCYFAPRKGGMRTNGGCRCLSNNPKGVERYARVAKAVLEFYSQLKPEKVYAPVGMTEEQQVEELKRNPELMLKMDGGHRARLALGLETE